MAVNSSAQSQAVKLELRVPVGHIAVSGRWRNTQLVTALQSSVHVQYEDSLGVVDFHPASNVGVIYVSEAELSAGTGYRRKCVKLRMANSVRGIVLVEKTSTSGQYFADLQHFCNLEMGLSVIPISGQAEAASLLSQIVHVEGNRKQGSNPFRKTSLKFNVDAAILATLQTVPKLGEIKAKQLLARFRSLEAIAFANLKELSDVVGQACAQDIQHFFGSYLTGSSSLGLASSPLDETLNWALYFIDSILKIPLQVLSHDSSMKFSLE